MKRMFVVLCFTFAAALLCGCSINIIQPSPAPSQTETAVPEPVDPGNTREPVTPVPDPVTPGPVQSAFTVTPMPENTPCTFHGTTYTITTEVPEDYWETTTRLLAQEDNGWESAVNYEGYFVSAYYIETQGRYCILLTTDLQVSDAVMTYVLDAQSLAEADSLSGRVHSFEGDEVVMFSNVDMLGTYPALRGYTFRSDLSMDPGDNLFEVIDDEENYYIVTTRNLNVEMLKNGAYSSETLGAGMELCVTATDRASVVYFKTRDNREGRFSVVVQGYSEIYIDAVLAEDCFEELPYAG